MCAFSRRLTLVMWRVGLGLMLMLNGEQRCRADQIFNDNVRVQKQLFPALVLDDSDENYDWWIFSADDNYVKGPGLGFQDNGSQVSFFLSQGLQEDAFRIGRNSVGEAHVGINGIPNNSATLHIRSSVEPNIRLETIGDTQRAWSIHGNTGEFYVFDSNVVPSTVPFAIRPGAPLYSLFVATTGSIGLGTGSPQFINGVPTGGNTRMLNLNAGSGLARTVVQGELGAELYMVHAGGLANRKIVRFGVNGGKYRIACVADNLQGNSEAAAFCIDLTTTNVGIKTPNPTYPLQVGDSGANDGNGAHVTQGGVWTNASSRAVKQDIHLITSEQARETVRALQPVGYRYKNEPEETYVGFIAEDVPELVATNDRKSLAPMDITAVLTRVVQDQDRQLDEQRQLITQLTQRLTALEQKLGRSPDETN